MMLIAYYYCVDIGGVQVNGYVMLRLSLFMRVVCINLGELCGHRRGAGEWGAVEKYSQAAYIPTSKWGESSFVSFLP